jgi:hypothetical protein
MVAHMMLAAKLGPEFMMTEPEAVQLSTAICNYLQHTKIKVNPKTEALMAMLGTVAMIEGTRIMAFTQRKAAENASKKNRNPQQTVVPLHPGGAEFNWQPPYAN